MMPSEPQRPPETATPEHLAGPVTLGRPIYPWYHKMFAVLLTVFCVEIGLFLLIFPWTPYWETNYFANIIAQRHLYWDNMYVRGAVSGLGVVNLYISLLELYRLRRFSRR
jgi:hypothetical protein